MSDIARPKLETPSALDTLSTLLRNPEANEVYGDGTNDYQTEAAQRKEVNLLSQQGFWYLLVGAMVVSGLYFLFG